jgi:alpha-galactosidase
MGKVTFMGAGSTVFARNVLGDVMLTPALRDADIALYDIDGDRLEESYAMLSTINRNCNEKRAKIKKYLGIPNRKEALSGADFVVNAIQVGGYDPCTITDFEVPKKFGLRQTIADTLGIGGIFRALRTIPMMLDFARDMEEVCPKALFLNYTNPMAMLTGAMLRASSIRTVGLCHSVQVCADELMSAVDMHYDDDVQWKIAGINHMGWLLRFPETAWICILKSSAAPRRKVRRNGTACAMRSCTRSVIMSPSPASTTRSTCLTSSSRSTLSLSSGTTYRWTSTRAAASTR